MAMAMRGSRDGDGSCWLRSHGRGEGDPQGA